MVIQHNLSALNACRMYGMNSKKNLQTVEKLSSGYRVNRAADDAAGIAISEKMRRQIRGLTQASSNAKDGISLVQIADGAMAEVDEMLHRGTELSIKAANGTLSSDDRSYIQQEINQLKSEINGITERATFNEIPILKGKDFPITGGDGKVMISGSMPGWVTMGSQGNMSESYTTEETYELNGNSQTATIQHVAATIDFSQFTGSQDQIDELVDNGFYTTCCTCTNHYSIRFTNEQTNSMETSGEHYIYNIGIHGVKDAEELMNRIIQGTNNGNPGRHYTKMTMDANKTKLILYDDRSNSTRPTGTENAKWIGWDNLAFNVTANGSYGKFGPGTAYSVDDAKQFRTPETIILQIGSEAGQEMAIDLSSISTKSLGIVNVDVREVSGAMKAITSFKNALSYVSEERTRMGAYQKRLEHTVKNLDNVIENTQAAESVIRDADMASLMVKHANDNILAQVGQSVLAQANQMNQNVLQLLQ